jgi:AraC-like DNA-binding protein
MPEVAAASGFGSPEYLARVFKQETGLTPHTYRNKVHGL